MHVPDITTPEGLFDWLLIGIVLVALLAAIIVFASWIGWLPGIDRLDGGGAVLFLYV